jgi:hypothetical protein
VKNTTDWRVDAESRMEGEITDLTVEDAFSDEEKEMSLVFKNTGNYHYKALARAELEDADGNVLASASTPLSITSIIPPNSRLFRLTLTTDKLNPGTYSVSATVEREDGTVLDSGETEFEV